PVFRWDRSCLRIVVKDNARPARIQFGPLDQPFTPNPEHGHSSLHRYFTIDVRGPFRLLERAQPTGEIARASRWYRRGGRRHGPEYGVRLCARFHREQLKGTVVKPGLQYFHVVEVGQHREQRWNPVVRECVSQHDASKGASYVEIVRLGG